jgi:type IV secretory pathway VirB10-like protein
MEPNDQERKDGIAPEDVAAPTGPEDAISLRVQAKKLQRFSQRSKMLLIALGGVLILLIAYGFGIIGAPKEQPPALVSQAPPLNPKSRTGDTGEDNTTPLDQMTKDAPKSLPPINTNGQAKSGSTPGSGNDAIGNQLDQAASAGTTPATPGPTATFDTSAPNIPPPDGTNNSGGVPNPGNNTTPYVNAGAPQAVAANTDAVSAHKSPIVVAADSGATPPASPPADQSVSTAQRTSDSPPVNQAGAFSGPMAPNSLSAASTDTNGEGTGSSNAVATRIKFANGQNERPAYLANTVADPIGKYELWRGSAIHAQLDSGINTDIPGPVLAHVTEDVYDSKTGQTLVIPKASRLHGRYNAYVANGQTRVEVSWDYLTWPDGKWISLDGMPGAEPDGNAGLQADVNDHRGALIGAALFTAVLSAGANALAGGDNTGTTTISSGQIVEQSVGSQLAQTGQNYINKKADIPPENTVPKGKPFIVETDRTIVLPPFVYGAHVDNTLPAQETQP